jgi:hypothetical protein
MLIGGEDAGFPAPPRRMPDRLKQGFVLFPGATGRWCLHGPGDRLIGLREEPGLIERLAQHLASFADTAPEQLRDVLAAFRSYHLLADSEPPTAAPLASGRVAVAGTGAVAARLADLLREAGVVSVTALGESWPPASEPDLLIACAGWLPDARWRRIDAWCAERGIPWHRVYQEGTALHFGPLSIPDVTAFYTDARARRLAAAAFPDELEALWQFLDGDGVVSPPPSLSAPASALAAALLAEDALALLCGRPAPSLGCAVELSLPSLVLSRHPVLPVPRGLLAEDDE